MKSRKNLTESNKDYAVFLPSISGFYNTFISKQRVEEYVPNDRIPTEFENGIEGCNFLNKDQAYFDYKWSLYSAGHAQLDIAKSDIDESMVQKRDKSKTWCLGDSGGFQIGKGIIKFDWENFYEIPGDTNYVGNADAVRGKILNWLEHTADYALILDVPSWAADPVNSGRTKMSSYAETLKATLYNNAWFVAKRQGNVKFLNALHGMDWASSSQWYEEVKHFPFEGWAFGSNNMRNIYLAMRRLIVLRDDKLLEKGKHDVVHFLGTSRLDWACMLTTVQRCLREHVNEDMLVTFDCASPFIATAHGQMYTQHVHRNNRFSYIMDKAVDNKILAGSTLPCPWTSPIAERMTMGDICYYKPGDLNKLGKEPKTSWDSFSYFLMMAHNLYQHIESVQRANILADTASNMYKPKITEWHKVKATSNEDEFSPWVPRNLIYFNEVCKDIFKAENPMTLIENAEGLFSDISDKRTRRSSSAVFNTLFDVEDMGDNNDADMFDQQDDEKLRELNDSIL